MSKRPEPTQLRAVVSTTLSDVGPEWRLPNPVGVVLEYYDNGHVVALWPEANTTGSGESAAQAFDVLRASVRIARKQLGSTPDKELQPAARLRKRALKASIQPA